MKLKHTAFLLFLAFVFLCLFGILSKILDTRIVNKINDREISWGIGWNKHISQYSGSELGFTMENSPTLSFEIQSDSMADQGLQIFIDNTPNTLNLPLTKPNIKKLTLNIDKKKSHVVSLRYFCTYLYHPCTITLNGIYAEGQARLLPYEVNKKIVSILGDSVSTIYGQKNYSFKLADNLGFQLHNASILGSTVSKVDGMDSAINRYTKDLEPFKSDITIVFLGTNDVGNNVPTDIFEHDYSKIVKDIKDFNHNGKLFLVGPLYRRDIQMNVLENYNNIIKKIAEEQHLYFIETLNWLSPDDFSDAIHPSVESQDKIASHFYSAISAYLK